MILCLFLRQWLKEALQENEPDSCFVFIVGTKRDLLVRIVPTDTYAYVNIQLVKAIKDSCCSYVKSAEECQRTESDAIKIAAEINAEFWSLSSKTGTFCLSTYI